MMHIRCCRTLFKAHFYSIFSVYQIADVSRFMFLEPVSIGAGFPLCRASAAQTLSTSTASTVSKYQLTTVSISLTQPRIFFLALLPVKCFEQINNLQVTLLFVKCSTTCHLVKLGMYNKMAFLHILLHVQCWNNIVYICHLVFRKSVVVDFNKNQFK